MTEKKDWHVTLSYSTPHADTYLIQNETEKDALWIAENQNSSSNYNCLCIKEVVWNSDKKDWLDKEKK